jgi:hypothetical protein
MGDWVQRSLLLPMSSWSRGPISCIYRPCLAVPSSGEIGVFVEKHEGPEAASVQNERGSPNPSAMPLRAISLVMGPMRQSRASRQ